MSGVGFWELMLVFLIGLIVLGPERLPRVAHQLGTWLGQARRMTRMMKRQLEDELNLEKDFGTRRPAPLPRPTRTHDGAEKDDRYSPAHAAGVPGTGVGSDDRDAAEPRPPESSEASAEHDAAPEPAGSPTQEKAS